MYAQILFFCLLVVLDVESASQQEEFKTNSKKEVTIQEVPYGKTAILKCHSNDQDHIFMFWQLATADVVGPGTKYNKYKYDYEVLSGNLTIRAVSQDEDGIYYCVSRGVKNNEINVRPVRMVVRKNFEEVWEHDPSVNFFRVVVVLGTIFCLIGGGYLAYRVWKNRYRYPSYLEASDEEEDSAEEIFSAPGTSRGSETIVIERASDGFDASISTDFGGILDNANSN